MITVDAVVSWEPCPRYTRERVVELFAGRETLKYPDYPYVRVDVLFAGRETLAPHEIAALDIPPDDIVWVLIAWMEACGHDKILDSLACSFAERALVRERDAGREPHPASWDAIETRRAWLRGKATNRDLEATGDAASYAVRAAEGMCCSPAMYAAEAASVLVARYAIWYTAWHAADCAARAAGCDAGRDTSNTSGAAASDAAQRAEARQQITMILEVMP